jgi:hypothetical protein
MMDSIVWWDCYKALEKHIGRFEGTCRIALYYIMDLVARKYGGLLRKYHEARLPRWLGFMDRSGALKIDCNNKSLCYAPELCLKAFLYCRKGWMRKSLEGIVAHAGPAFADVARLMLGEGGFPRWCGSLPGECSGVLKRLGLA